MLLSFKKATIHTLSTFVFQQRMMESRPAEYNRPVCLSSWSAFTPDLWRGSSSSLITNDMVTFRLGMAWLWGWPWEWPEDGRIPAAILHLLASLSVTTFVTRSTRFQSKSARVSRAPPVLATTTWLQRKIQDLLSKIYGICILDEGRENFRGKDVICLSSWRLDQPQLQPDRPYTSHFL